MREKSRICPSLIDNAFMFSLSPPSLSPSLHAKLMLQNSDEYSASSTPNLSRLEATLLSQDETLSSRTDNGGTGAGSARGTFSIDYDAESLRSVSSTDYSVDPEVKQREAVKEQLLLQDVGKHNSRKLWQALKLVNQPSARFLIW